MGIPITVNFVIPTGAIREEVVSACFALSVSRGAATTTSMKMKFVRSASIARATSAAMPRGYS